MRYRPVPIVLVCAAAVSGSAVSTLVRAAEYMSVADAQKQMYADAAEFVPVLVTLTSDQVRQLAERAGGPARADAWRVWQARGNGQLLGFVVAASVIGKFELIDFAVSLGPRGDIRDVEILTYRESHGYEVRTKPWRGQFAGKTAQSPLRIGEDIQNISGATLSCTHLTDAIRRIATMTQLALVKA